jgi:hypothetical protein
MKFMSNSHPAGRFRLLTPETLPETSGSRITEKIEHRTSNIERPTSNNEFYQFIITEQGAFTN